MAGQVALNKKQGVSGQSVSTSSTVNIEKVSKDFHTRTLIKEAIQDNDFLKNLTASQASWWDLLDFWKNKQISLQMQDLTDAMHEKKIPKGCYVIREGKNRNWNFYPNFYIYLIQIFP